MILGRRQSDKFLDSGLTGLIFVQFEVRERKRENHFGRGKGKWMVVGEGKETLKVENKCPTSGFVSASCSGAIYLPLVTARLGSYLLATKFP